MKFVAGLAASSVVAISAVGVCRADTLKCDNGFPNSVRVITLAGVQTTSSQTPVNIPGAAFRFIAGSRCLVVEVTGQVRANSPRAMRLSLVVTGNVTSGPFPATRDVYSEGTIYDGRSATFFADIEGEEEHVVRVQFMSVDGSPVSLKQGVIVIHYLPAGS